MDLHQLLEQNQVEIFLDFDGTITEVDTLVLLLNRFAPPSWWDIENEVLAGKLNEQESLQREMDCMQVSWEEAREFLLQEASLRDGFHELIAWLQQRNILVTVLSGGFRRNVDCVFQKNGINLPVCANDVEVIGNHWRVIPAPHPRLRDRCNHCKTWHLEQARKDNRRTIYIGDGTTDFCAAGAADFVFARDNLLEYCRQQKIPHLPFDDFHDVLGALAGE